MSLQLLPGIVWALDDFALKQVQRWQNGLSEKARTVFKVASCWEECVDLINNYRQQSFDTTMLVAGLGLETQRQGRRINIVIAACFPQEGGLAWAEAEKKIEAIAQQPVTLEQHRVLLHPTLHQLEEPTAPRELDGAELTPLRFLPWLLTRQVTGGFILSEEEFHTHFSNLLDALFLAEREGGVVPGHLVDHFYHQPAQSGHVRLAGFSRIPIDALLQEMAQSLAQMVLAQAAQQSYDVDLVSPFEKKLAHWLSEFLAGQRSGSQIEEGIPRELSRHPWPVAALLNEAPRIFAKESMRLHREPAVDQPACHNSSSWWQRLLAWLGQSKPSVSPGPDPLQAEALGRNLDRMVELLRDLADRARPQPRSAARLPEELCQGWTDNLRTLILQRLQRRWGELDVMERLAWQIEQDLAQQIVAVLQDWEIPDAQLQEVAAGLAAGNLLSFSAPLHGARPVQVQALITSLTLEQTIRHEGQNVPCATVRLWPGRPPLLLAASEPVPVEHLHL
jgi:hypothetical protein